MTARETDPTVASAGGPVAGRTSWQRYVDLIRALDTERATEEARTSTQRQGAEAAALEVERLAPLLIDQGAELSHLGRRLRLSPPRLSAEQRERAELGRLKGLGRLKDPVDPFGPGEHLPSSAGPYELVRQATQLTARAGSYAREAHYLGTRARFLPGAPAGLRNFVLYLAWALAGLPVQYAIVLANQNPPNQNLPNQDSSNQDPSFLLVLVAVPLVAYLGGLVSVSLLGRVRLAIERPGRSPRMGALICFGIFPFGVLALMLQPVAHKLTQWLG